MDIFNPRRLDISPYPHPAEDYNFPRNFNFLLDRYELAGVVWISYDAKNRTFRAIVVKEEDRINEPAFINLVRRAILLNSKKK